MKFHRLTVTTLQDYKRVPWPLRLCLTLAVEQTSTFPNLPIDILNSICDELPLHAKILLCFTCKPMWYLLRSKCSRQLKAIGRFNALTELGNLLPDKYHCVRCNELHPVGPDDVPDMRNWYYRRHVCFKRGLAQCLNLQYPYAVYFHHVQLALKYSRMPEKHQDCRTNILKNVEYRCYSRMPEKHQYYLRNNSTVELRPVRSTIIKSFVVKPKVVNSRFLLLATYVLCAGPLRDAAQIDTAST